MKKIEKQVQLCNNELLKLIEKIQITIIGSGNVATVFGRLLNQAGFIINEIISRNQQNAKELADELNAAFKTNLKSLPKSDVYIIAVSDSAVENVSSNLFVDDKIVIHTCGSVSKNVLKNTSKNYGVLYPLQSLRKEINYKNNIPLLIDANNDETKNILQLIASSISKNVKQAGDNERLKYHLSAVMVSNFANHLFALTKKYCDIHNLDFAFLLPLIEETVSRMHKYNPAEMQTGPAIRGDVSTIEKHIDLLKDFPQLQKIYELMSESIMRFKL